MKFDVNFVDCNSGDPTVNLVVRISEGKVSNFTSGDRLAILNRLSSVLALLENRDAIANIDQMYSDPSSSEGEV